MLRFCSWACALLLVAAPARAAAPPGSWILPPLDGELAGEFSADLLGGAPPLNWKLSVRTEKPLERTVEFQFDGSGFRLRGDARLDPKGEGAWRIAAAEIDLAVWFGWLAPRYLPYYAAAAAAGRLELTGEGTWRGRVFGGKASLSLRDGRIDDPARKFLLEGISVDVAVADIAARRTEPAQVFTWRNGRYDVVTLGVGRIEFALDGDRLTVNKAAIDMFGGELNVGSLVMSLTRPEYSVVARLVGVAVDQIMVLMPALFSEARGSMDGEVRLKRDARGIQIGDGHFALREGETADLRLAIKPGWLSTALPPQILKVFPTYQKIETGEIPLRARVLELTITPLGDEQGRTAWAHIVGGPNDPELTAPIDTKVNVRGPLDQLINLGADFGTNSFLSFGKGR